MAALAKAVLAATAAAQSEVAAMPAGQHPIIDRTRQAVERRARSVLANLQQVGEEREGKVALAAGD